MPQASKLLFASSALALLVSCGGSSRQLPVQEMSGSAMGTAYNVKIVSPPDNLDVAALQQEVDQQLAEIERQMSTYIADSELSSFNAQRRVDWFVVSGALCRLVADALSISAASGGAFDITVGPLVNLWGFGPEGSVAEPPDPHLVEVLLRSVGSAALHADCSMPALRKNCPDVYVDLSAIAKGYGVDQIAALLDGRQVQNYLVEIGGELRVRGNNANGDDWAVAIEAPLHSGRSVHTIVKVTDAAVATSGDYRNFFEHQGSVYSHTIDPRTGYPVTHKAASVTVVAGNAAFADAMATALLVLGPEDGLEFAEREGIAAYYLVRDNGAIDTRRSSKFAAEVRLQ